MSKLGTYIGKYNNRRKEYFIKYTDISQFNPNSQKITKNLVQTRKLKSSGLYTNDKKINGQKKMGKYKKNFCYFTHQNFLEKK